MARKILVGHGARTRDLVVWFVHERLFCLALYQHSQRPRKVAVWQDHLEAVPILSWPAYEPSPSRVFPSKQHRRY